MFSVKIENAVIKNEIPKILHLEHQKMEKIRSIRGENLVISQALALGELSQVEGSNRRWRGVVSCGGEQSLVEGSGLRWREAVSGGGERSLVEGSGSIWRGAVSSLVDGSGQCKYSSE